MKHVNIIKYALLIIKLKYKMYVVYTECDVNIKANL